MSRSDIHRLGVGVALLLALLAAAPAAVTAQAPARDTTAAPDSTADTTRARSSGGGSAAVASETPGGHGTPCIQRSRDGSCDKRWRPDNSGSSLDEPCVDADMNAVCDEEPAIGRKRGFFSWIGGLFVGGLEDREKKRNSGGDASSTDRSTPKKAPEAGPRQKPKTGGGA